MRSPALAFSVGRSNYLARSGTSREQHDRLVKSEADHEQVCRNDNKGLSGEAPRLRFTFALVGEGAAKFDEGDQVRNEQSGSPKCEFCLKGDT
jgi:hypothetical protein